MKRLLRTVALRMMRIAVLRRAALAFAARRERALILVYHRVLPDGAIVHSSTETIVPTVSTTLLRQQLEALAEIGDFVSLPDLVDSLDTPPQVRPRRVRFALTFDDDEPSHLHHALPVIQALGIPATFFLCGRALHGLGPPWWIRLEAQIGRVGLAETAGSLGIAARSAAELAAACEGTPLIGVIERTLEPAPAEAQLSQSEISALAAANGVTIGFHSVEHPVMTLLNDDDVIHALGFGHAKLARRVDAPLSFFAYPHGRCDSRIAERARAFGFRAAFQSGNRPVGPANDSSTLGRWEAGPIANVLLLSEAAWRFNLRLNPDPQPKR